MHKILKVFIGILLIILFTQVSFDLSISKLKIPITGQSLAVLIVGYVLGIRNGTIAVLLYLVLGVLGAPIFADGAHGVSTVLGNTGGFLVGFVFGTMLSGWISDKYPNTFLFSLIAMLSGTTVILIFGITRLSFEFGINKALIYGFYPFWIGALVKVFLGSVLGYYLRKLDYFS